jgi:hypothetical protein
MPSTSKSSQSKNRPIAEAKTIAALRGLWQEAITSSKPGQPMKVVLDRLKRKYQIKAEKIKADKTR